MCFEERLFPLPNVSRIQVHVTFFSLPEQAVNCGIALRIDNVL